MTCFATAAVMGPLGSARLGVVKCQKPFGRARLSFLSRPLGIRISHQLHAERP
jgi:hypothetical protein